MTSLTGFSQTTWYVTENGAGNGDGTSWSNATDSLQNAIDSAEAGDEIWVAAGTYYPTRIFDSGGLAGPTARERTFYISKNIGMYGGFAGNESSLEERDWVANVTVLDGNYTMDTVAGNNVFHVVYFDGSVTGEIDSNCILSGFEIRNGIATGNGENSNGGGIYLNGSNSNVCSPSILHCLLYDNACSGRGGAIFSNGESGESSALIANCALYHNAAGIGGGGIGNNGISGICKPSLINCTLFSNSAPSGEGLLNNGSGGICIPYITNSILWSNEVTNNGGATPIMTHCLYDDGEINGTTSLPGGTVDGGNNLDAYPLFADTVAIDLSLSTGSPAINAGINDSVPIGIGTDLSGVNRTWYATVDMGAYEYFKCPQSMQPIYVDSAANSLTLTGLSWDSAFTDLQWAIDLACECMDEGSTPDIWVSQGTYYPTRDFDANNDGSFNGSGRERTFYIHKNVKIYGGFTGTETMRGERDWKTNPTLLSGDLDLDGTLSGYNSFHVLYFDGTTTAGNIDSSCVLDGFQVILGNANGSAVNDNGNGGGVILKGSGFNNACSPNISNCTFTENKAIEDGGAIYSDGGYQGESSPNIDNCTLQDNEAKSGGAIFNNGEYGNSSPIILNTIFSTNTCSSGGAIYNNGIGGISSPSITNCLFYKNSATASGGAVCNIGLSAGQIATTVINSTFHLNSADNSGGAIWTSGSNALFQPSFVNCIFWANQDEIYTPDGSTTLTNCILDDGTADGNVVYPNGTIDGGNNLDAYPEFVNSMNGDFRLLANSPAINAGINDSLPANINTDLTGVRRIFYDTVDIGAYEFFACPQLPQPIYVDRTASGVAETGLSWDSAFTELQYAIDLACACNAENNSPSIWVSQGTYHPTRDFDANNDGSFNGGGRERTFYIPKNMKIYGGFAGNENILSERDWMENPTILSGDLDLNGSLSGNNAFHVIYVDGTTTWGNIDSSCVLDGLKIVLGNATGSNLNDNGKGAGILLKGTGHNNVCSPNITNCTFEENNASSSGGAIYSDGEEGESSPYISNCIMINNNASIGGAICNHGQNGISSPLIINSKFTNNSSNSGGAIYNNGRYEGISKSTIKNCLFYQNSSMGDGGAIYNHGGNAGLSSPFIINSIFFKNSTLDDGGAIYNVGDDGISEPSIVNCIFWDNEDEIMNSGASPVLTHSILDDGTEDGIIIYAEGTIDGGNNLDAYPLFVDTMNQIFDLLPYSPAINAGINDSLTISDTIDLGGNQRIIDGIVDIGAYENLEGDCPQNPVLDERYSPLHGTYQAGISITLMGGLDILSIGDVTMDAPSIQIEPTFTVDNMGLLEIKMDGCN